MPQGLWLLSDLSHKTVCKGVSYTIHLNSSNGMQECKTSLSLTGQMEGPHFSQEN